MYSQVLIYYFSGTGNARNAAVWFGDEAKKHGLDFEMINIAKVDREDIFAPDTDTLVGFISPTHGFHFPRITTSFIGKFPLNNGGSAFVMNRRAGLRIGKIFIPGLSGILHYWCWIVLRLKGYSVKGLYPVDLPSNWLSIHPAVRKKGVDKIYNHIEPRVRLFARKMIAGKRSYRALYDIIQDLLIAPVALGYVYVGRYLFAKSFIASNQCNMCGLCEKSCPVRAIKEVDGRMYWTLKCESCMKCMNECPHQAIESAHGFIVVVATALTITVGYLLDLMLTSDLFSDWTWLQNGWIRFAIKSILLIPFLVQAYKLMHWLKQFKSWNKFFIHTSLSHLKFWKRYQAPKLRL